MVDQQKEQKELLAYTAPEAVAHSAEVSATANLSALQTAKEKSLEIEGWMTDNSLFSNAVNDIESEPAMVTEAWMLDKNIWIN